LAETRGKVYLEDCESRRHFEYGNGKEKEKLGEDVVLAGCHSCVGL